jgi:voltage-gated potassium channel
MAVRFTRMQGYLLLFAGVLIFGTLAIMAIEGLSAFDAVYFVVVTIATVGYGDISPSGTPGRAVTIILILAGVGTFVAVFAGVIENLFAREERRKRQKKVNMIIGAFFSEFGTAMLSRLARSDPCIGDMHNDFLISDAWTRRDFERLRNQLSARECHITVQEADFSGLKACLLEHRVLLLSLLEHPAIFEHETFTELLQAFFHLSEELSYRKDPAILSTADTTHLLNDLNRGYRLLLAEWVNYMEHLQEHYPYLFSLAMRTNPFDPGASAEIP